MGDHGNNTRDRAALRHRVGHKDGDRGIAGIVTRAADAVVNAGPIHLRGIDIAVDVRFHRRVHRNDAETADDLGAVGDLRISKNDLVPIPLQIPKKALHTFFRQGEGSCRCHICFPGVDKIHDPILHHFRVKG